MVRLVGTWWFVAAISVPVVLNGATDPGVVGKYCAGCHNERLKTGGLVLDGLEPSHAAAHPDVWEKVARKLRANAMPPAGMPQPDPAVRQNLIASLEDQLDRAAEAHPNPGRPDLPHYGAGETVCKPLIAAVANAIYDATGVRLRRMPFRDARVLAALKAARV